MAFTRTPGPLPRQSEFHGSGGLPSFKSKSLSFDWAHTLHAYTHLKRLPAARNQGFHTGGRTTLILAWLVQSARLPGPIRRQQGCLEIRGGLPVASRQNVFRDRLHSRPVLLLAPVPFE